MRLKNSVLIFLLFLASCTPQRRFTKLIEKHPYLLTIDTLIIHDTVRVEIPKVVHDTVFTEHFFTQITRDTLILKKERLTVKIFHDTIKRSVYIRGECDTIFIERIIERKIPIKYYEKTPTWKRVLNWILLFVILSGVGYGAYRVYKIFM